MLLGTLIAKRSHQHPGCDANLKYRLTDFIPFLEISYVNETSRPKGDVLERSRDLCDDIKHPGIIEILLYYILMMSHLNIYYLRFAAMRILKIPDQASHPII
jgi:hypothetical protein